jgi:hypothetical protein
MQFRPSLLAEVERHIEGVVNNLSNNNSNDNSSYNNHNNYYYNSNNNYNNNSDETISKFVEIANFVFVYLFMIYFSLFLF